MSADEEEDDVVVRELDVHLCNGVLGNSTQLYLFQYPLRPPWRPYGVEDAEKVRMKPVAKRVEMVTPLDDQGPNYNQEADKSMQMKSITLCSSLVELRTSYAVGTIRDNKLLLSPLDAAVQMRPSLAHLDAAREDSKNKGKTGADEEDAKPDLMPIQVEVKRRETERQTENRLKSYAYLAEKENEEAWVELVCHSADTAAADQVWEKLMTPRAAPVAVDMRAREYLTAIVPGHAAPAVELPTTLGPVTSASPLGAPEPTLGKPKEEPLLQAARPTTSDEPLSSAAQAALPGAIVALFKHNSVVNLDNIREWLLRWPAAGPAKAAANAPDTVLHEGVLAAGNVLCIRTSYMLAKLGNPATDLFRAKVLEVFSERETARRSDIMDAARGAGIPVTDSLYSKVLKDLCTSRGTLWSLKIGA